MSGNFRCRAFLIIVLTVFSALSILAQGKSKTFCNPLNLNYRFSIENPSSHRTAADPLIVLYRDVYYLFASKSGGYWYSDDMREWTFVQPTGLPLEDYAPSMLVLDGKMYYTAHRDKLLFETDDPKKGVWTKTADIGEYADPMLFLDDDRRVYMYFGSSLDGGISVVELDPRQNFKEVSPRTQLMKADSANHGWEGSGADNLGYVRSGVNRVEPYIEGSWMTKHDGVYYLQYAAPGTIWNTYADGIYTSKYPDKEFIYQPYSPFSYKPGGFAGGAGHSGTFRDRAGNYWRVVTMIISVKHKFERRLGLFPAGFEPDGEFRMNTYFGDYPQFIPGVKQNPVENNSPGWMLLSFNKKAEASSTLDESAVENAFDEDIRTVWSAKSGAKGEFLAVDLGGARKINAVQINFAEQDTTAKGRAAGIYQQYTLETSRDGKQWKMLIDKSQNKRDAPHDYIEFSKTVTARFVKITNYKTADGKFAVRDLRVFGSASGAKPETVGNFTVRRNPADARKVSLEWQPAARAAGHNIRYGTAPQKMFAVYQLNKGSALVLNALNKGVTYYFAVEAFNENGIGRPSETVMAADK
ncbi:MAG TPA: family 43 glycosylhydrolase [Pyrinomonadaceae bacterium]|jgi:hypothetical protein